ncbi:hypothetical protein BKG82_26690 [Mycobacteroides chelonae]|uniref:Uncharacterized protein n=1 Tax=Mycobacteroides chelonae TaxID=1774 RepID=A0A1S1LGH2_MYCCH|nr:hypothetical protein [Mycobacteroides chelonae]OHU47245.1 hypothetical protein BKG82_26690 [Mycobacteroides chelonae]
MTVDDKHRSAAALSTSGDMALWPRIRQAIYATAVSRAAVEWRFPRCHKKNCGDDHGDVDFVVQMVLDSAADAVLKELLCRAVSEPDEL